MRTMIGKIGLLALVAFAILAILQPEYMPHAEPPYDKLLHFGLFALAAGFAVISTNDYRIALTIAGLILIAGISIEIIQAILPGRSADMMDAAANALGVISILAPYYFMRREPGATPEENINKQIVEIYREARAAGESQAKGLEKAAETYRLARPQLEEHEIRLQVVKIIEDQTAH